jgi:16S rRNA processing protein RimM
VQLVVARIGRAHGVRGEVTIEVRTDKPDERLFIGGVLETEPANLGPLKIASIRNHNGTLLLSFVGREERSKVEELRNALLIADVALSDETLDEDEFHATEILGCSVFLESGENLGEVIDILQLPSQDTLVVKRLSDGEELLIPFVKKHVPELDLKSRKIVAKDVEGLL